jgi:5-deoxy-5-amino-3-dehydroquinate synthase
VSATEALNRVDVQLGDRAYPVHIGPGARRLLPEILAGLGASAAFVVTARPREAAPDPGPAVRSRVLEVADGEAAKTMAAVAGLCEEFARFGLTRGDVVVSCGGGSTTDTVGLAAALYHRGIPVVHVPTSLLAQVDASVGGKTAVNLPSGKNLAGTYWQPAAVLCDTDYLASLPERERVNGYGEIARCHFIGAGDLRGLGIAEQITASVTLKARIVAADERDTGLRQVLNYGHTLGHAIEHVSDFAVRHGEAVGIGTVFAGRLARALGRIDAARSGEHEEVVRHYGLPTRIPAALAARDPDLVSQMRRDKKTGPGDGLVFVLDGPDGVEPVRGVPESVVRGVLAGLRE